MDFPNKWRKWVMNIIKTARALVLVNGSPTQEFPCFRGLKQGDPLSPFLSVLAMEALTRIVKEACSIGRYKGVRLGANGPLLSHFLFVDDVIFMDEWFADNVLNLNRLLRCFYLSSGLWVNFSKSNLYGVGIDVNRVQSLASILRCKAGSFPFKYQ
ncbi:uncharacterized mitochondrial protein AtMg01250-like [Helianthus annuus]|uniref:uncharacterized mitochondrial protein AtMg01250-like n=1 Tax=Helianthus annuus TaxID=4232 RepID=UPI000B8FCB13|nr:uncharacterized mitochondrial protein AtMg01250-like [Helianthus annuus]